MTEISIIGPTIRGNRGAEAMLTTVVGRVRERDPNVRVNIYSYYPEADRKLNRDPDVRVFSAAPMGLVASLFPLGLLWAVLRSARLTCFHGFFPDSIRRLANSDALVDLAGVAFIDGREKFIPFNVLTILPAMLLRIPVIKFSQAIGPCNGLATKLSAGLLLPRCRKIFARGERTLASLKSLGLPDSLVEHAADAAFHHADGYSLSRENEAYVQEMKEKLSRLAEDGGRLIAICPSSIIAGHARKEGWNYPAFLCRLVSRLLDKKFAVLLFPNATIEDAGEKLRNNDIPVIEDVVRYLAAFNVNTDDLLFINRDVNYESIKEMLASCDVAVVSRFHAMIAALSLEKPVFVLGWGLKYVEVMEKFGLEEFVVDYKKNDIRYILEKVEKVVREKEEIKKIIRDHLPEMERQSRKQFEYLYGVLGI